MDSQPPPEGRLLRREAARLPRGLRSIAREGGVPNGLRERIVRHFLLAEGQRFEGRRLSGVVLGSCDHFSGFVGTQLRVAEHRRRRRL